MSSNINPYNIDGAFPVAGQDNPSQGFRDNFTNIKNNFIFAHDEINDLQSKAIVSSALNNQTISNDMAGTPITRPQLRAWTQSLLDLGTVSNSAILDFNLANFQKITTASSIYLSFINWPTSVGQGSLGYGVMRVWINVTSTAHTVTLPTNVTIGENDIAGYNSATGAVTFDAPGNYVFDFSSIDGGLNYLIFDVTRNRATHRDPSFYYNPGSNNTSAFLIGYGNGFQTALALETGQDIVSAFGSYNSVSVGNIQLGNVYAAQYDAGGISGYSVTGARGNVVLGNISPVRTGDILGYVNALQYTGTGVGNSFQQSSSIAFYTAGSNSNLAAGLGGNIAFFTTKEGTGTAGVPTSTTVKQAMSINSDQTVQVMGSLRTDGNIIENGTFIKSFGTSGDTYAFTSNVSTLIIDSLSQATVSSAAITLPSTPATNQKIRISSVVSITSTTLNGGSASVRPAVATSFFATAGTALALTYSNGVWYRS